ncbi:MAG: AarF/ABC1/UbiB kinase family protein [Syntrophomonas sp.]
MRTRSALFRFFTVIYLFVRIFWAFYLLKFKKIWHRQTWLELRKEELYASESRRFRETAVTLGGLLIKLGQFFSTRVDILPQVCISELEGLQDEVSPVAFDEIKGVIESEFCQPLDQVFAYLDPTPLASASLGQVHRGRLPGNEPVAVKILRPGIEELVAIDLKAIGKVINLMKAFTDWDRFVDLDAIYEEFSTTICAELDYIKEGHNAETIAANNKDPNLLIPEIVWDYTRKKVLTMEFMEGIKINSYAELAGKGIDLPAIARKLLQTYVKQVLVDGFFHADPHPGNLFVTEGGQLVMVDYGMVGTISTELRDRLLEMVFAMIRRDYKEVVEYLKVVGFLRHGADDEAVTRAVALFIQQVLGRDQKLSNFDLNNFLDDLEILLYEQPFQIPANFTFLGRALGTLYGLCIALDPGINFLDVAKPYLDEIAPAKAGIWQLFKDKGSVLATSLLEIPPLLERVLTRAEQGDLNLRIPLHSLNEALSENTKAVRVVAYAIAFGFSLLVSAYLQVNHFLIAARYCFLLAAFFLFLMFIKGRSHRTHRAPHPPVIAKKGKS